MTRIARYRDPCHSGRDLLDHLVVLSALLVTALINFVVFVPALAAVWPLRYDGGFASAVLMGAVLNLVIMRGVSLLGQHLVRRWIFDREQRRHEIVPHFERRKTRA